MTIESDAMDRWLRCRAGDLPGLYVYDPAEPAEDREVQARVLRAYAKTSKQRIAILVDAGMVESGALNLPIEEDGN